jgi:phage terminase large subunit-like protein
MKINFQLIDKHEPILTTDKNYICLYGGRGSAKSNTIARYCIAESFQPNSNILCAREFQSSIKESVYTLLENTIRSHKIADYFKFATTYIQNRYSGNDFVFVGLREHTVDSVKSYENRRICWVEEAQSITARSMDILIPTIIRNPNFKLLFSYNRYTSEDPVHELTNRDDVLSIYTNIYDNPFIAKEMLLEAERMKIENYEKFLHIYMGEPMSLQGTIFNLKWFSFEPITKDMQYDYRFITADTAYKDKQENDYHCFSYWGVKSGVLYLIDVIMEKLNAIDVEKWCLEFIKPKISYNFRYVWIEDKGHGIYLNQKLPNYNIPIPSQERIKDILDRKTNKVERANNILPYIDKVCYNIKINTNIGDKVLNEIKQQLVFFPNKTTNDDFVDTFIDAVRIALATKDYSADMRKLLYG